MTSKSFLQGTCVFCFSDSGLSTGVLIAIIVAGVLAVLVVIRVIVFLCMRAQRREGHERMRDSDPRAHGRPYPATAVPPPVTAPPLKSHHPQPQPHHPQPQKPLGGLSKPPSYTTEAPHEYTNPTNPQEVSRTCELGLLDQRTRTFRIPFIYSLNICSNGILLSIKIPLHKKIRQIFQSRRQHKCQGTKEA